MQVFHPYDFGSEKMLNSEIKKVNWENRTLYFINMYVQIAMYFIKTWQNLYLFNHFQIYKADIHFWFFHFVPPAEKS